MSLYQSAYSKCLYFILSGRYTLTRKAILFGIIFYGFMQIINQMCVMFWFEFRAPDKLNINLSIYIPRFYLHLKGVTKTRCLGFRENLLSLPALCPILSWERIQNRGFLDSLLHHFWFPFASYREYGCVILQSLPHGNQTKPSIIMFDLCGVRLELLFLRNFCFYTQQFTILCSLHSFNIF